MQCAEMRRGAKTDGKGGYSILRRAALSRLPCVLLALIAWVPIGAAAELVMFESALCEWCEMWHAEIGVVYHKTEEGRAAPLRRVDVHDPRPADLRAARAVVFTPTFVLMSDGAEVGRIVGYPGEDHFWGLLDLLLGEMDRVSSL